MKFERVVKQVVEVDAIRVRVPVESDAVESEEITAGMFGLNEAGDELEIVMELDSRKVRGWPSGATASVHLKVRDEGSYELLSGDEVIAKAPDYVPDAMPGEHYGDYLILDIGEDGTVAGWRPTARQVAESFGAQDR